jgi:cellulose synthase/poly-beta-1,6-N-acetylglucosamine synthase-like glycosyltransferase
LSTDRFALAPTDRPSEAALPLGEALVERGLISKLQLRWALETQERTGVRLGRVLLAAGLVRRQRLYEVLADLWGCDFVDLVEDPPDADIAGGLECSLIVGEGWIPFRLIDGTLQVATSEPPSEELAGRVSAACPESLRSQIAAIEFLATTDWDVHVALGRIFRTDISRDAAFGLSDRYPLLGARGGLTLGQRLSLELLVGAVAIGATLDLRALLVALIVSINSAFVLAILFKFVTSLVGASAARKRDRSAAPVRVPDDELPIYTVLVPLFREANVVGDLIENLRRLDYPQEKLEILLLMEEDDRETIEAAKAANPPDTVRFVLIPFGLPQTKPRACNVGLFFARGDYLVIYDAEDRPDPEQLRDAVAAFRDGPESLVCVQARLNYFNAHQNLLTRMFTLEYSYWFDCMLPGLDRLGLPIPLGGTSNHFDSARLRELGGWDAFNVTEDADLGVRASVHGYTVGVIDSTTYEEACSKLRPWIRQRTRWIKGYMQTAIVHSRRPLFFARQAGLRGVAGFLLLIAGTPASFLAVPVMWLLSLLWYLGLPGGTEIAHFFPYPFAAICTIGFIAGNGVMIALNVLAVTRRKIYRLALWALIAPFYWLLLSLAAWRALFQLVHKPFYWEKTPHGLTPVEVLCRTTSPSVLATSECGEAERGSA